MGSLCIAGLVEFECPVAFVHSYVNERLRAKEWIGFTDKCRFLPGI